MYLRTKDGFIYEYQKYEDGQYTLVLRYGLKTLSENEVLKKAKTIEALLDEYVCLNQIIDESDFEEFQGEELYGNIWVDNELIKAAEYNWYESEWRLL